MKNRFRKTILAPVLALMMLCSAFIPSASFADTADAAAPAEDGVYAVNGQMLKVPSKAVSMADNAINHNVKVTVSGGRYRVTADFNSMNVGNAKGYLKGIKTYSSDSLSGSSLTGTLASVTIDSYQSYTNGRHISDSYGTDYPNLVSFDMIPEALTNGGYIPMQVTVPAMAAINPALGTQDVYLGLDWSTARKTTAADPAFDEAEAPLKDPSDKAPEKPKPAVKVKPAKVTGLKAVNTGSRTAKVSWKKAKNASGYIVYRSTSKKSGFKAVRTVKSAKTLSYINTKLKKNKTYYYKVRAYRTYDKSRTYGSYSSAVSVKIKK